MVKIDGITEVNTMGKYCDVTGEKIAGGTRFPAQIISPAIFRIRLPYLDEHTHMTEIELDFSYPIGLEIFKYLLEKYPQIAEHYNHLLEPYGLEVITE